MIMSTRFSFNFSSSALKSFRFFKWFHLIIFFSMIIWFNQSPRLKWSIGVRAAITTNKDGPYILNYLVSFYSCICSFDQSSLMSGVLNDLRNNPGDFCLKYLKKRSNLSLMPIKLWAKDFAFCELPDRN
ncbi:hypothetical protein NH340_JMT03793 [Sarcoptes scabiei]|nr:hypothetical protein NH340_JMT03793 [Sarcoptes scabiei]